MMQSIIDSMLQDLGCQTFQEAWNRYSHLVSEEIKAEVIKFGLVEKEQKQVIYDERKCESQNSC